MLIKVALNGMNISDSPRCILVAHFMHSLLSVCLHCLAYHTVFHSINIISMVFIHKWNINSTLQAHPIYRNYEEKY